MVFCFLGIGVTFSEEQLIPHVIVIVNDGGGDILDFSEILEGWESVKGEMRVSPGRAATAAAIMYGLPALQSGVVTDADWRRLPSVTASAVFDPPKPVSTEPKPDLKGPLKPRFRLFTSPDKSSVSYWGRDDAEPVLLTEEPLLAVIQQGGGYDMAFLRNFLKGDILSSVDEGARPVILMYVAMAESEGSAKRGVVAEKHHYGATWQIFQKGGGLDFLALKDELKVDFQIYEVVQDIMAGKKALSVAQPKYHVFHRANWPLTDNLAKYRHRDSLVVGNGFALVDGFELYKVTASLEADLTKPLDIAENVDVHAEMLLAHTAWWAGGQGLATGAKKALEAKHATFVDERNGVTRLSLQDWQASGVVSRGKGLAVSTPISLRGNLINLLENLKDEQFRETFPPYSGSWLVHLPTAGRYKVTARLLPNVFDKELAKLQAGRAFIQLGENQAQLNIQKGATAVTAMLDAEAGVVDLECWFTGQLPLERELGAFFVEIKRVGGKMYRNPLAP